jgi:MFS family permease
MDSTSIVHRGICLALENTLGSAAAAQVADYQIPGPIKRNTWLLALSQAFSGTGNGMVYSLGPIMVVELLHSASLAGIGLSIVGATRFLSAYPIGKLTDTYGRKPGMLIGLGLGVAGAILMGLAAVLTSFPLYVVGMIGMGIGTGAAHQLRVAATDMYPPSRRAEGLGYVLTGSIIGVFVGPLMIAIAQSLAPGLGVPALGLSWWFAPIIALPGFALIAMVRPDPIQIAARLDQYYPGYVMPVRRPAHEARKISPVEFLKDYTKLAATASSFAAQATMAIVMVTTSLVLAQQGHGLPAISASLALHSIGMFGFSLPIGRASDELGRRRVIITGLITGAIGALLVGFTAAYWSVTIGTFLVGLGWSGVNVASTAMVADTSEPEERGRAVGTIDTFGGAAAVLLPLATGPIAAIAGLPATGLLAVALVAPALVLMFGLSEPRPGFYQRTLAHS